MNRLTGKTKDGKVYQPLYTATKAAFYKLAQYEDTGLEPEEVMALKENGGRKNGEWIDFTDDNGNKRFKCSVCEYVVARNSQKSTFCPTCGAQLKQIEKE